jgi:DNA repair protein RadA/Sms
VVGGLYVAEPALDLALAAALASSVKDRPLAADLALIGEIGLSGELRSVAQLPARLNEAAKLGFKRVVMPKGVGRTDQTPQGLDVVAVHSLKQALDEIFKDRN